MSWRSHVSYAVSADPLPPNVQVDHDAYLEHLSKLESEKQIAAEARQKELMEEAAKRPEKGRRCRVVRGRKVPKGTEGVCIWVGRGGYGERVGIKDDRGVVHWTAATNVEAVS